MDWQNEHWIKLYTRNTPEWIVLSWKARALFRFILTEVDRAGQVGLGKSGAVALAALVRMPVEDCREALAELKADGCIQVEAQLLTVTNFLEAQEALTSNKQRQVNLRARRNTLKLKASSVTQSNAASRDVTNRVEESRVEERRVEDPPLPPSGVLEVFGHWRVHLGGKKGPDLPGKAQARTLGARLERWSVADLKAVVDGALVDAERWPDRLSNCAIGQLYRSDDQVAKFVKLAQEGAPKKKIDVTRGIQHVEDQGWDDLPAGGITK